MIVHNTYILPYSECYLAPIQHSDHCRMKQVCNLSCMTLCMLIWLINLSNGFVVPNNTQRLKTISHHTTIRQRQSGSATSLKDVRVEPSLGDPKSIRRAAAFMVESFWLGSSLNLLESDDSDDNVIISEDVKP